MKESKQDDAKDHNDDKHNLKNYDNHDNKENNDDMTDHQTRHGVRQQAPQLLPAAEEDDIAGSVSHQDGSLAPGERWWRKELRLSAALVNRSINYFRHFLCTLGFRTIRIFKF